MHQVKAKPQISNYKLELQRSVNSSLVYIVCSHFFQLIVSLVSIMFILNDQITITLLSDVILSQTMSSSRSYFKL